MPRKWIIRFLSASAICTSLFALVPFDFARAKPPTPEERAELKKFANRMRNGGQGVLLTPSQVGSPTSLDRARAYVQGVVDSMAGEIFNTRGIQVRVNLYSGRTPNAFATRHSEPTPLQRRFLGLAKDGKPIFELGVNLGMLGHFENVDEMAFILGHELGHILSDHFPHEAPDPDEIWNHWYSGQAREVEADLFALSLMGDKYNLDAAYDIMDRLLPSRTDREFLSDATSSHHHPSVRLSLLLAKIQALRRARATSAPHALTPLPESLTETFHSSPRQEGITNNFADYRKEYLGWFLRFLNPRNHQMDISNVHFKNEEIFPIMNKNRLHSDGARILFRDSIGEIMQHPGLGREQRIERIMELLSIFQRGIIAWSGPNTSGALQVLSDSEIQLLRNSLVSLAYTGASTVESASGDSLMAEFGRRIETAERSTPSVAATLRDIEQSPPLASLFTRLSKTSPIFRQIGAKIFDVNESTELRELVILIKEAFERGLPEHTAEQLVRVLENRSFPEQGEHLQKFLRLAYWMNLPSRTSHALYPVVMAAIERIQPEHNKGARQRLHSILNSNPEEIPILGLEGTLQELGHLISPGQNGMQETISLRIRDLASWYFKVRPRVQALGYETSLHKTFRSFEGDVRWQSMHALRTGAWRPEERMGVVRNLLGYGTFHSLERWVEDLPDEALRTLLTEERQRPLQDAGILRNLASILKVPEEIVLNGINPALARMFHRNLGSKLNQHLQSFYGEFHEKVERPFEQANRTQLNLYDLVLHNPVTAQRTLSTLSLDEFEKLTQVRRDIHMETQMMQNLFRTSLIEQAELEAKREPDYYCETDRSLVNELIRRQSEGLSTEQWMSVFQNIVHARKLLAASIGPAQREALSRFLDQSLSAMPATERMRYLKLPQVLEILPADIAGRHLTDAFLADISEATSLTARARRFAEFQKMLNLNERLPELNRIFESVTAERLRLQPGEIRRFFSPNSSLVNIRDFSGHIRGLSGMVSHLQRRSVAEQIEFIEYMLGRKTVAPAFLNKLSDYITKNIYSVVNFTDLINDLRARLSNESALNRALIILPFYTGRGSITGSSEGVQALIDRVLLGVSPANLGFARELAHGILSGEGKNAPLAFALLFGQRSSENSALNEGQILRALFNAYGTPGVKFGQYLAFTSDMANVRGILGELQDQAMPLSYLEAIRLLETHFPDGMPQGIRIIDIKGSGSVNIGIEYFNPGTDRNEVLTVSRAEVEAATGEDFRRIRNVISSLVDQKGGHERYGFLQGLDRVIQKSVQLEFNRPQVFENHRELSRLLNRRVGDWNVRMVEPYSLENGVIRMQKAQGVPARIIEQQEPALYRRAMTAASTVITDHLLREDHAGPVRPGHRYFADSDFHNGQVFIDANANTVWLIDPGQAVAINDEEFKLAKQVLRLVSGAADVQNSIKMINDSTMNPHPGTPFLDAGRDLSSVLSSHEPADAFVKFISAVELKGGEVPLPVVQWVLGMNRQLALSRTLGSKLERRLLKHFGLDIARNALDGGGLGPCIRDVLAILKNVK